MIALPGFHINNYIQIHMSHTYVRELRQNLVKYKTQKRNVEKF